MADMPRYGSSRTQPAAPEAEEKGIKFNYSQTRYGLPPGDPIAVAQAMVEMKNFIDAIGLEGEVTTFYNEKSHTVTIKVVGERQPS